MRAILTSVALIVGLLGAGVSPAFAAKGVKKNTVNGVHHIHGVVTHVHHHKTKNGAGHIGEITVKTHHHKKKGQPAVNGQKVTTHTHKFTVGANTHFSLVQGKQHKPANFSAVHVGEHVSIAHKSGHAESVAIHHHTIKGKNNGLKKIN
jgi:hypothetical protein